MKLNSREVGKVGRKKKAFQPEEGKREDKIRSPFCSLEMDEGALSGKQLSLLNYALISLANPKKVRGEIPQQGSISPFQ